MITIWKYPFPVQDEFELTMRRTARVLSVQMQNGRPAMWASVETDAPDVRRKFFVRGTGHYTNDIVGCRYLGTIQDGPLVWHVFDSEQEERI